MARVFLSEILQIAADSDIRITQIAREFKLYKETGRPGVLIGRDADIRRPLSAKNSELMHAHLYPKNIEIKGIPLRQYNRTSDIFLIYCEGIVERNAFLLIDIIWNNAHDSLSNESYVRNRLVPIAEKFREKF